MPSFICQQVSRTEIANYRLREEEKEGETFWLSNPKQQLTTSRIYCEAGILFTWPAFKKAASITVFCWKWQSVCVTVVPAALLLIIIIDRKASDRHTYKNTFILTCQVWNNRPGNRIWHLVPEHDVLSHRIDNNSITNNPLTIEALKQKWYLFSLGSMVQNGKFSAAARLLVRTLKKVDFLWYETQCTYYPDTNNRF